MRIAEFRESSDAQAFQKLCGDDYVICGGINMPWAVREKEPHELVSYEPIPGTVGRSDEPTDYQPARRGDYDAEDCGCDD